MTQFISCFLFISLWHLILLDFCQSYQKCTCQDIGWSASLLKQSEWHIFTKCKWIFYIRYFVTSIKGTKTRKSTTAFFVRNWSCRFKHFELICKRDKLEVWALEWRTPRILATQINEPFWLESGKQHAMTHGESRNLAHYVSEGTIRRKACLFI